MLEIRGRNSDEQENWSQWKNACTDTHNYNGIGAIVCRDYLFFNQGGIIGELCAYSILS